MNSSNLPQARFKLGKLNLIFPNTKIFTCKYNGIKRFSWNLEWNCFFWNLTKWRGGMSYIRKSILWTTCRIPAPSSISSDLQRKYIFKLSTYIYIESHSTLSNRFYQPLDFEKRYYREKIGLPINCHLRHISVYSSSRRRSHCLRFRDHTLFSVRREPLVST